MDVTLTGAVGGVAILAIVAGYELSVIARSHPEPAKEYRATPVLIPTPERPVASASSNAPAVESTPQSNAPTVGYAPAPQSNPPVVAYAPAPQADVPQVSSTIGSPPHPPRVETPPPIVSRPKDPSPPPAISTYKEPKPPPPPKPLISADIWEVR